VQGTSDLIAVQARLERFRDERDWARFHGPTNLAKAISVEAAELLELFLWVGEEGEDEVMAARRDDVEAELADVLIQCLNFANATGVDVLAAVDRKIQSNEQRYPVEKARGNARKHTDL
jgi:NTP pyrophosphatase (non-canonical NTP hydrolase)